MYSGGDGIDICTVLDCNQQQQQQQPLLAKQRTLNLTVPPSSDSYWKQDITVLSEVFDVSVQYVFKP